MDSNVNQQQSPNNNTQIKWTKGLIWGAVGLLLSCFAVGLGLVGGIGSNIIKSWEAETNAGLAFTLATVISFVLCGLSVIGSLFSIISFVKKGAPKKQDSQNNTSDVSGIVCAIVAILITIICIISNIYWIGL